MEHRLPTAIARLGSGLAAMGTLAWLLWPAPGWKLEPEQLVAFLLALGGRLSAVTVPALLDRKPPHPHDAALLARLKELITPDHIAFLHDQDFAGTISPHPMRGFLRPRTRHNQHVPADRRRRLHLRRAAAALAILVAG